MKIRNFSILFAVLLLLVQPAKAECDHEYVDMRQEPTCKNPGMSWQECTLCGDTRNYDDIPAVGHRFGEWAIVEQPTCGRQGTQTRTCMVCAEVEEAAIPALGHSYVVEVVPPTCTARGYTSHYCTNCKDRFRTDYTDALGHRYDGGVVTKEPTQTAMGRIKYTCVGCGDTYQEYIDKLVNPFEDVKEKDYYFRSVLWAVDCGITTGVDATHFCPEDQCTRAQVAVFLWRMAGKPAPKTAGNPFADVCPGDYFEKAVLWAYESGITTGVDASHFGPDETCTRGQVVTFLHRYHGAPAPETGQSFPDVKETDYYHNAVLWAAQREITVGMDGGRFCPEDLCTRGQIVTFLYRDVKNP